MTDVKEEGTVDARLLHCRLDGCAERGHELLLYLVCILWSTVAMIMEVYAILQMKLHFGKEYLVGKDVLHSSSSL